MLGRRGALLNLAGVTGQEGRSHLLLCHEKPAVQVGPWALDALRCSAKFAVRTACDNLPLFGAAADGLTDFDSSAVPLLSPAEAR